MKYFVCVTVFVAGMLAQWAWNTYFSFFGLAPQLLVVMTIALASQHGAPVGLSYGFAWGLFMDVLGAHLFGANALALTVTAYLVAIGKRQMDVTSPLSQILLVALLSAGYFAFLALTGLVFERQAYWVGWPTLLLGPVLNALAAPTLFYLLDRTVRL